MGLGGVSIVFIVGLGITCVGTLFHLIGIATTSWSTYELNGADFTYGLFRGCVEDTCADVDPDGSPMEDEIRATQAMVLIGILLAFGSIGAAVVHILFGVMKKQPIKELPLVAGGLAVGAFLFILIGIAIWGGEIHNDDVMDVGYSAILSIIGMLLLLAGGSVKMAGNFMSVGAA